MQRFAKVPAAASGPGSGSEPLEAGRRYLHRGTSGDVSANVHRRPRKSVVTEVRWCTPHANPNVSGQDIPAPRHFGVRKWWELPALTDTGLGPSNAASQCCPAAAGRGEHHVDRTSADAGVVMDVEMGRKLADIQDEMPVLCRLVFFTMDAVEDRISTMRPSP